MSLVQISPIRRRVSVVAASVPDISDRSRLPTGNLRRWKTSRRHCGWRH